MKFTNYLRLNEDALYSIQFQGILGREWAEEFGSMQVHVSRTGPEGRSSVTTVVGEVVDQAALSGLLNLVYNLGLPLLSVSYLGRP